MRKPMISEAEANRLRAAGIAVPESEAELLQLLEEAERDPRRIPLDEAIRHAQEAIGSPQRRRKTA